METKHTPGPWRVVIDGRIAVFGPRDKTGWPETVAYNLGLPNDKESLANARLIAAAPDMLTEHQNRLSDLTLLRRAIEEDDPKKELLLRIDDMLRDTRATISKAKGKTA